MHLLKKAFDFYIDASIHVALAVYAMVWISLLNFNIPYNEALGYVAFCTTIVSYNFMKYGTSARKYFIVSSSYIKIIQVFSFLCFGIAVFYGFGLSFPALVILAITSVLAVLYTLPFLPGRKTFRSLHGVKVYMVALCWSLLTVVFPVAEAGLVVSNAVIIEFIQRFLLVLVLLLPFDIRDLKHDELSLGTIPQQLGIKRTRWLGILMLVPFYFLLFLKDEYTIQAVIANGIITIITGIFVFFSGEDQSRYYSSFYVESIPVVWLFLYVILDKVY